MLRFGTTKGITPVIAIVLLLLVTVGAVGVVYTQFQDLVGDDGPAADFLDADATDITMSTIRHDDIRFTLRNSGVNEYDLHDDFRVDVGIPGESRVPLEEAADTFGKFEGEDSQQCLAPGNEAEGYDAANYTSLGPGEEVDCETGIDTISGPEEATFYLVLDNEDDEVTSNRCDPSTSSSATC